MGRYHASARLYRIWLGILSDLRSDSKAKSPQRNIYPISKPLRWASEGRNNVPSRAQRACIRT